MSIDAQNTTSETASTTASGWKPTVGQTVIAWNQDDPIEYGGRTDDPRLEQVRFGFGQTPQLYCEPDRVAPADAPLPDPKDSRIQVTKGKKPYPWLSGNWCLALPKQAESWHKTKRDAVADGRRRLAIVDWHAKHNTAQTPTEKTVA